MTLPNTVNQPEVGIIVGRFQSPELHTGHIDLINSVISQHSRVIIFLGLSPVKVTSKNPLDYEARRIMINEVYPDIEVHYIKDVPSDVRWSKNLDSMIGELLYTGQHCVLYGSRDGFQKGYHGKYPVVELRPNTILSASDIRKSTSNKVKGTFDFRAGVIWAASARYPVAYPAVDIVAYCGNDFLLAKKSGEEKLRFVGGFVDPTDPSLESAARREFAEETGYTLSTEPVSYIYSFIVDDWRYRSEADKIMSTVFKVDFANIRPEVEAKDDIESLHWVPMQKVFDSVQPEHLPIVERLIEMGIIC